MDKEMMDSVVKTLKSDLVQVTGVNEEEVAALVLQAKGEGRTLTEFAKVTGISKATLSRIMNGKISRPLTPEIIVSIIGNSESNTLRTMYELARANGYMSKAEQTALRSRYKLRDARNGLYVTAKSLMMTIITAELFQRGGGMDKSIFDSQPGELPTAFDNPIKYDFAFGVESETENYTWYFFTFPQKVEDFQSSKITADKLARNIMRELSPILLTDAWYPDGYAKVKISFCFTDAEIFEEFSKLMERGHLNNDMSLVLLGDDKESGFVEERVFQTSRMHTSPFSMPKTISINFTDDDVADEIGECNFLFVEDGEDNE